MNVTKILRPICNARPALAAATALLSACAAVGSTATSQAQDVGAAPSEMITILTGDPRFSTPPFDDFQAEYNSSFSKTGRFSLIVRSFDDGAKISVTDMIPGDTAVIVSTRIIDAVTHQIEFSMGPYFAWGPEVVIGQATDGQYDWTRIPIGGGEPKHLSGDLEFGGYIDDTFAPSLASLMPLPVGTRFQLPAAEPRRDETVANVLRSYEVIGREHLALDAGVACTCWVIEQSTQGGSANRFWVSREAPFIYRWHRDIGGSRDLVSEVQTFQTLAQE